MKNTIPTILMILLFSLTLNAQNSFEKLWQRVEKYEVDELPKSALKIVETIYDKAAKENNSPQIIKSLFYKSKFALSLEENAQLKVIQNFKKHISNSSFPTKNVLENILANLYWQFFNENRYQFYNRTKTTNKVDKNDFRTWDLTTLFAEIHKHYKISLKDVKLIQGVKIHEFSDILQIHKDAKTYQPSLFDFLAKNALEFYKSSENSITRPTYKFNVDNPIFLSDASKFSKAKIESKDSLSLPLNALKTYQKLIQFHLSKGNKNALAFIDLERMEFVKNHAVFSNKEAIYLATLTSSKSSLKNHEASGLYAYEIAKVYRDEANNYKSSKNQENRFKNKKALAICNNILENFPKSLGAKKCASLKAQILNKILSIKAEKYIPINKNSRILVSYNNIDKLYFKAYKTSSKQLEEFRKLYLVKDKIRFLKKLEVANQWKHILRNENDYLNHTTEVIVPKLSNGTYLIFASQNKNLEEETVYGTAIIQVTNLILIENNFEGKHNYQVVDRNNGKPYKNAEIRLKNKSNHEDKYIHKKLITDKNGFASYRNRKYFRNVEVTVKTKNDYASFGNRYLYEYGNVNYSTKKENKDIIVKPFIFTDRSIYRPGQKVYFKAIVLKKQGASSEVLKNEYVEVVLRDVNNQKIKQLDVKLNEFGSVSGEFNLPNNGLTGEFSIEIEESVEHDSSFYDKDEVDFLSETEYFSVEEYKRPKFKTDFKPVTESFKVNDSIVVIGFAKAFSGANVTDAKVVYRVQRKVQYPDWWYWYRPNPISSSQEIIHGESMTDASGNFKIQFKAIPDKSVSKESLPIFSYEITADVTDINGETRSATTLVKVGYHALIANITIPEKINKNDKKVYLKIDTKNLNDEFVTAKGVVKIFKLKSPKNPLRKRPWSAPDYQDISENTFRTLFPNDPYSDDETDEKNWQKGTMVSSSEFDTKNSKELFLQNIKNWNSGKYIALIETKDKFGQSVKDEKRFSVFSNKENKVTDNKLFVIHTDKTFYKVGDEVNLQIDSASKNITVTVQVEKDYRIVSTYLIRLKNCIETIKIPVHKDDVGGFAIKYHFANFNDFQSGNLLINVPEKQENIEIETNIFRDKLQPGADETWSFTVKNDKNNKVTAEILASMYDASLDEFKLHNWNFNPIAPKQSYYSYQKSNANHSFGIQNFHIRNNSNKYLGYPRIGNTTYKWFGFSLNNNNWVNRQYIRSTKRKLNSSRTDFDGTITGVVEDETGALPGVSITIKGTSFGTETDFDGNYSIRIKKGDVLTFSYIGYKKKEFTINNHTNLDVKLEEDESALDEVVVVGYGTTKKKSITGTVSTVKAEMLLGRANGLVVSDSSNNISIRGAASLSGKNAALIVVDGKILTEEEFKKLNQNELAEITVLKDKEAISLYGSRAKNGAIIITTKKALEKLNNELSNIKARKNFKETAFFFPQLKTDKNGKISFSFTMPEVLTKWKLQLLAHTTELKSATKTLTTVTQKELMVVPNAPRFLREGDKITLSAKITNLTNNKLSGFAKLILTDAISGKEINADLQNTNSNKNFTINKDGNTKVSWNLAIPETVQAIQYKIVAKAGDFSDGEQNVLPVLTNKMLVTETLPMWIRSNQTKTFTLEKLKNNTSSTLKNHKLTLEMTSNPVWHAIQSLPYLMEYPYECAEQTFSRYYANTLASFVANSNPRIQEVFNAWKSSDALLSNLEKNQELKSLIIQETPWLRDTQSESEQKKRIALLFDLNKMKNMQEKAINKLKNIQMNSGGFPWFKGSSHPSNFITQHIATGFGHLQKLGVTNFDKSTKKMIEKAVGFLDSELLKQYEKLLERAEKTKQYSKTKREANKKYRDYLNKNNLSYFTIQYLYMRSFYNTISMNDNLQKAIEYYRNQTKNYWNDYNLYAKGQIALSLYRNDEKIVANKILKSLKENSITSDEFGMYWKSNKSGYWYYQAPIETQALLIEVFSEIQNDTKTIDNLKIWLLKNKQTNRWKTTKATTEAIYALLLNGSNWISTTEMIGIKIGDKEINPTKLGNTKVEAGTGYFKTSWSRKEIKKNMAEVTLSKKENGIAWGGLYWQYFEDLDKITSAETSLKLKKKLFLKVNTNSGKELQEITKNTQLKVGDLITVRIELRSDRNMEFIHMKDMRASGVEPINVISKYKWQDNLGYYESTKDAATNFFFDYLPKGVYVFEYDVRVNNAGNFSNGITTIQSMYAPEFSSHSEGVRINISDK